MIVCRYQEMKKTYSKLPPGQSWPFAGPRSANKRLAVVMGSGDRFSGSGEEPEPGYANFVPGGAECIEALYPGSNGEPKNEVFPEPCVHTTNVKALPDPIHHDPMNIEENNSDSNSDSSDSDSTDSSSSESDSSSSSDTSESEVDDVVMQGLTPAKSSSSSQQNSLRMIPDFLKTPPKKTIPPSATKSMGGSMIKGSIAKRKLKANKKNKKETKKHKKAQKKMKKKAKKEKKKAKKQQKLAKRLEQKKNKKQKKKKNA